MVLISVLLSIILSWSRFIGGAVLTTTTDYENNVNCQEKIKSLSEEYERLYTGRLSSYQECNKNVSVTDLDIKKYTENISFLESVIQDLETELTELDKAFNTSEFFQCNHENRQLKERLSSLNISWIHYQKDMGNLLTEFMDNQTILLGEIKMKNAANIHERDYNTCSIALKEVSTEKDEYQQDIYYDKLYLQECDRRGAKCERVKDKCFVSLSICRGRDRIVGKTPVN